MKRGPHIQFTATDRASPVLERILARLVYECPHCGETQAAGTVHRCGPDNGPQPEDGAGRS